MSENKTMSDRLSPENLGKDLYIAYAIDVRGVTREAIAAAILENTDKASQKSN
jgi:hypothetical protein